MTFHSQSVFYRNKPATVSFSAEVYNVKPDGGNIPAASGRDTNFALKVLCHSLRKKKDGQKNGSGTLWSLFAVKKNTKKIVHQSVNITKLFKTVSFMLFWISWLIYIAVSGFRFLSDSDCKPNGYIVICRTFHTARSQIQIAIPTAKYRNWLGIGI